MLNDCYHLTDADDYTTITRAIRADLDREVTRLRLKAPIHVVRLMLKHGSFNACYWAKVEEFTVG